MDVLMYPCDNQFFQKGARAPARILCLLQICSVPLISSTLIEQTATLVEWKKGLKNKDWRWFG
jgi:hypothetical protein